ncbi:MAG: UPF0182 family protein [Fulvivirga sp.]|nr:UPF0182 family protein [Fulvivirga sp.]
MFVIIFFVLLAIAIFFTLTGHKNRQASRKALGIVIFIATLFLYWFMNFWGEKLWFDAIGYNDRFWTLFFYRIIFTVGGVVFAGLILYLLLLPLARDRARLRWLAVGIGAFFGGTWGFGNWNVFLKFWYKVDVGLADPILGKDVGFYLFSLPFYDQLQSALFVLIVIALVTTFVARFKLVSRNNTLSLEQSEEPKAQNGLYIGGAALLLVLAFSKYLERFHLLFSDLGAVSGPGWTDVNIKLPALTVIVIITTLAAVMLLIPGARRWRPALLKRFDSSASNGPAGSIVAYLVLVFLIWFLGLTVLPGIFQKYRVEPNEITYEKPYIANNIEFTRHGFKLDSIEEKEFPAADTFTREMVKENKTIFNNIRLWDWRALDAVLKQFQEIRLYYEFTDVDIDRYTYDGNYRQVMVSAREMEVNNLPLKSQTFVNKHFKYTHGYGIALTTVTDFTPEGLPNLLVKNIPPETEHPELAVTKPQIYYGELTDDYAIVNSSEQEFDYPQGDENMYISYPGKGGVQISNFWRKLIYSYKLGGTKLLFSSYPTDSSRIMFRRQIKERVQAVAPFLELDDDPYIVNANGELYWMLDAYTTSPYFPYSEPFSNEENIQFKEGDRTRNMRIRHDPKYDGVNYIRNSVKVVINAFDGSVNFYVFDSVDPLIRVWDNIFPGLLKPRSEMPKALLSHIRYPVDYLLIQGLMYAKYHMNDPEVFYNQEDLWIRATENYYGEVQPVSPYYITWELPESDQPQFSLILPFTPKNRQVSIGWIAGLCEPENYGRFLAYNFPKEKRVLGPQQVETKIDQNSFLSGQLSLWDQRGSSVIRGNVLAIPVENSLIYVEPIYLQAETAAYPELRLVCVMHNDNLSYAPTFEDALNGIFGEAPPASLEEGEQKELEQLTGTLIEQANQAFKNYMEATGAGNFDEASRALKQLQQALEKLNTEAKPGAKSMSADTTVQNN